MNLEQISQTLISTVHASTHQFTLNLILIKAIVYDNYKISGKGSVMKISTKLNCNMLLTAVGIIIIAGFSFSGMKYVQGKLHVLTEKSTPYQLKTIALQRSLQEHISNLLKVTSATTESEHNQFKGEITNSLAEVKKVSEEVASLKGDSGSTQKLQDLEIITTDIVTTVGERIKAEAAGKTADKLMDERLLKVDASLARIAATMKTSQKKTVGELSSTNDNVKRGSVKNTLTQAVISAFSDIRLAILEISSADQKAPLDAALAHFNTATQAATKNLFMRTEKNNPIGKEITATMADITKMVTGSGGILEIKAASLVKADDSVKSRLTQDTNTALQKISKLSGTVSEFGAKVTEGAKEEGKKFDKSLENSVMLSEHLANNSDLIGYGSEIRAIIKAFFSARTTPELTSLKGRATSVFARTHTLLTTKMKNVEGAGAVSASLAEVRQTLLAEGGAADKLQKIIQVNQQLQELNGKLKTIVIEQRKEGEAGMTTARMDQENAVKSVNRVFRSSIVGVSIIGFVVLVIGVLFSIFTGRSITKPIQELSQLAERFGNGDFNCNMDTARKDEFGALAGHFNGASSKLRDIVGDLTAAISQLKTSSDKLNSTSERLRSGAHEQASQAAQSATALEEMSMTINEVAQHAAQAAQTTKESSTVAVRGNATVSEAVDSMIQIATSVAATADKIQKLGESSERIGSIINVINDIADQTNLLALNAAIEAARAGEFGMGFAVVANVVRNLAKRTMDATQEIGSMVKEIQGDTDSSIRTMAAGKELVNRGVEQAQRARAALESIVAASDSGAAMVVQIATAAEEQSAVVHEVSAGVERMADLTKVADQDSEHVSAEARELSRIAGELGHKAQWFKF